MKDSGFPNPGQPEIKRGEIAILLSTRGRPEKLLEVFDSLRDSTVRKDNTTLWLAERSMRDISAAGSTTGG